MKKVGKILNTIVLVVIILFSILIIGSSLNVFGFRLFVVKSGSMEPKIHTGSVVFDERKSDYVVGNIITFKIPDSKDTVTHRIVEIKTDANKNTFYIVKGDANNAPDPDPVSKDSVVGKVALSIPYLGYLVAFIRTLPGIIIFIVIPATIIIYQELTNIKSEVAKLRATKKKAVEEIEKIEKAVVDEEKKIVNKATKKPKKKAVKNET